MKNLDWYDVRYDSNVRIVGVWVHNACYCTSHYGSFR